MPKNLWTREELIATFNLYLKIPFGRMHHRAPEVIGLANTLGRTPSSIAMRLGNFASVDPYHQKRGVSGLKGGINQVKPIWDEFSQNREELIFLSEQIIAHKENNTIEKKFQKEIEDLKNIKGEYVLREVKTRVNQNVFRQIVISNYKAKCAITGIDIPEILIASHIIPWAKNEKERLNPENGICLSTLYDTAFDKGLIGITPDYKIVLSEHLCSYSNNIYFSLYFHQFSGKRIELPEKYLPKKEFLEFHLETIFLK